jgi:hypothetical protein
VLSTDDELKRAFEQLARRAGTNPRRLDGILRRHHRRRSVLAVGSAIGASAVAGGAILIGPTIGTSPGRNAVVDPVGPTPPAVSSAATPQPARPCREDQLRTGQQLLPPPTPGDNGFVVQVENRSERTCALSAVPDGVAIRHGLPDYQLRPATTTPGTTPAVISPGQSARVWIQAPANCDNPDAAAPRYPGFSLNWSRSGEPPEGGINLLREPVDSHCGLFLTRFYTPEDETNHARPGASD